MAIWPYNTREWWLLRRDLLGQGQRCEVGPGCGREATELDHFPVPLAAIRAGRAPRELALDRSNVRPACKSCNSRAGAHLGNRRRRERRWQDPRTRRW